jgi:hypothetical protein
MSTTQFFLLVRMDSMFDQKPAVKTDYRLFHHIHPLSPLYVWAYPDTSPIETTLAAGVLYTSRSALKVLDQSSDVEPLMMLRKEDVQKQVAGAIDVERGSVEMRWSGGVQDGARRACVVIRNGQAENIWWEIVSVDVSGA